MSDSRYAKLSELRIVFLRSSCFSILVTEIFAIIQMCTMLTDGLKVSQPDVWRSIILVAVLPVMFVHHAASAFKGALILPWVDLLILVLESFVITWILVEGYGVINPLSDRTSPFLVLAAIFLLLFLVLLMILRISDIWNNVARPANRKIFDGIFGQRIQEPFYKGETEKIIVCRVALTVLFLVLFPFYVASCLVVQPLQSAALLTVRESFSHALPPDFEDITNARWTVVITSLPDKDFASRQMAQQALEAISVVKLTNNSESRCIKGSYVPSGGMVPDHIFFNCIARAPEIAKQGKSGITAGTQHFVILVYANYNETFNSSVPKMYVRMGLTNDTAAVIRGTRPAILGENQNMVGEGEVFVRRELKTKALATLGLFSSWNTYLLTDIGQYFNDPNAIAAGYAGPGLSTMIMNMDNARYRYRVVEDHIDKTVLDGFSAIGGLFGLIGSTAALLFGRSILQLMFGSKQLSLFGIVHKLDKDRIQEAFKDRYPNLKDDLDKKGYVYLLHDRVLDIESAVANSEKTNLEQGPTKDVTNSEEGNREQGLAMHVPNSEGGNGEKGPTVNGQV